ncbi:MAG TPA: XTP/dITP diphosphatase [Thermoplasmatales archaeon]|nr:XTP/dITP diphosphatase [Thermoplasmatales archaeon]
MRIWFATQNKGKFIEAKTKLEPLGVCLEQYDKGYPEIQADSLEEVAMYGIGYLSRKVKEPFFLEDAGLFIDSLNGFPGVYSAYVFKRIGCEGILKLMEGKGNRSATFRSIIAYKEKGKKPLIFEGSCRGIISTEKRGNHGFGYDPIFIPEGSTKTFGEMVPKEKNRYSHRGNSLNELSQYLKSRIRK